MSTLDRIRQIVAEELSRPLDEVTADKSLFEDLGGDDIDRTAIVIEIEQQFKVAINDDEMEYAQTVDDLVKLTERAPRYKGRAS